jgi:hypothetical protein
MHFFGSKTELFVSTWDASEKRNTIAALLRAATSQDAASRQPRELVELEIPWLDSAKGTLGFEPAGPTS